MRSRSPPVVALALCFGLGCAAILSGALSLRALILSAALLLPILPFLRPEPRRGRFHRVLLLALVVTVVAGALRAGQWRIRTTDDCRLHLPDGWSGTVTGRFVAADRGGAIPFEVEGGLGRSHPPSNATGTAATATGAATTATTTAGAEGEGGLREARGDGEEPVATGARRAAGECRGVVRSYVSRGIEVRPGVPVRARADWQALPRRAWTTAETTGYLTMESVEVLDEDGPEYGGGPDLTPARARGVVLRVRGEVQGRLQRLFGPLAPVTEALILARKEGLDPGIRDDFARAGLAHLLAISGFHVGIVAGLLLFAGRLSGVGPRLSPLLAATGAWGYVLAIGSPDAAVRAAILLGLLALGPLRTRPLSALGALASALVAFLLVDPGGLARVGFQLSFAGTGALILWSRSLARETEAVAGMAVARLRNAWMGIRNPSSVPEALGPPRLPQRMRVVWTGLGGGIAATLGTLPLVAWHFGQVPLFGIPATVILGPLVALSIPGIFLCLAVDLVASPVAEFLAGGVGILLEGVVRGAGGVASLQGEAGWVSRWHVVAGALGMVMGWTIHRAVAGSDGGSLPTATPSAPPGRIRGERGRSVGPRWVRRALLGAGAAAGLLLAPLLGAPGTSGTVEIAVVDVGQGDALAIRSPKGRWILVDTGPRSPSFDAGARRVLPHLRREGVRRLEALVLTHPDLDHIGGAPAVLEGMEVAGVLDPGRIAGKASFEEALLAAAQAGVPWWPAASRSTLHVDGLEIRVLHPEAEGATGPAPALEDANEGSVVLLLRYGAFQALLTGDAPAEVEEEALRRIEGPVQVLKVGHHGSLTSTSRRFVEALRPEAAVISVGWRNRYGHPHPEILERLGGSGTRLYRTDLHGTVVVRARDDGSWSATLPDLPPAATPVAGRRIDPRSPAAYR